MEISVKNFGPIKHGSIDLSKRFYVFVGHNNSGKTYMANLVWSANNLNHVSKLRRSELEFFLDKYKKFIPKISIDNNSMFTFPNEILDDVIELYRKKIQEELNSNLGIGLKDLLYNRPLPILRKDLNQLIIKGGRHSLFIGKKENYYNTFYLYKESNSLDFKYMNKNFSDLEPDSVFEFGRKEGFPFLKGRTFDKLNEEGIMNEIIQIFFEMLIERSIQIFLPANRLFYPSFYRYVYEVAKNENEQLDDNLRNGEINIEEVRKIVKRPYTKAMGDLLNKIYRLDASAKPNETYIDLLQKLRKLMGGEIVTKNAEGIGLNEFKLKMDSGEELDLYLSSSAANQLTTLYLYLKYWASDKNNFLIMDEPEENLHPKHQIALLDILMQFANRNNNRVLITTHSSLLAESVNNHIQIGKLQDLGEDVEKIVQENNLNISLNDNLRPDDFGVYFFGNGTITPYDVDDYGVFFRDFKQEEDKVALTAQVLSEHIYHSLRKDKNIPA